tara:strand:- start:220 stop:405 length:186 start_codon:yes stop_codon:yes gene_type:complete
MGYMSEMEIIQFAKEQMSIKETVKLRDLEDRIDKLEIMVRALLDGFNELKEPDIGKKKKNR